jgi:hypothetical protein
VKAIICDACQRTLNFVADGDGDPDVYGDDAYPAFVRLHVSVVKPGSRQILPAEVVDCCAHCAVLLLERVVELGATPEAPLHSRVSAVLTRLTDAVGARAGE